MIFNKVETEQQAKELIKIMPDVIAVDTEYIKGDPRFTTLLSVIIADSERAWAVDPLLLPMLTPTLESRKLIFLQDYNHCDTIILLKNGCDLRETNCHNLIDMHHLIDENSEHSLGGRALENFKDDYKRRFWDKYKNYEDASEEEALEYACRDAIYTYRIGMGDYYEITSFKAHTFNTGAAKVPRANLYEHVRQLSKALLETQLNGVKVNVELMKDTKALMKGEIEGYLGKLREEFNDYCEIWELQEWQRQIDKRQSDTGKLRVPRPSFSFNSDKQVAWLVYEALKLPIINKTKKGNPSTDFETLQTLAAGQSNLERLVRFKDIKSTYATFVEGMLERVRDGFIYPDFNVSGTNTGRISHSNPNMGNLPRTGVIRNFFVPREGMLFIGADYSQLEVVVEANLTEDPQLLRIINEGKSKHDITAEGLGIDRNKAKTLNFALQYGAGSGKVASILACSKQEAEDIYRRYWELYSGVSALKDRVNKEIQETGQITNLAGRTRHFEPTNNKYELFKQQRQAYNFLIQGVAAEACNRAFYKFSDFCKVNELGGNALFSVHDEILCEVPERYVLQFMGFLKEIMEQVTEDFNFKYPLKAIAYGPLKMWSKT
jgi:DNA polymerase I-like protein with 3'-5' exonuclease and polymerase domains